MDRNQKVVSKVANKITLGVTIFNIDYPPNEIKYNYQGKIFQFF